MKKIILSAASLAVLSTVAFADADSFSKSLISNGYGNGYYASHTSRGASTEAFADVLGGKVHVPTNKSADFQRRFEKAGSASWMN